MKDHLPIAYSVAATACCISLAYGRPALPVSRHPDRQYADFASFWPLYVQQHAQPSTKLIHACGTSCAMGILALVVGGNAFVRIALGVLTGASISLMLVDCTASLATGLTEALIFLALLAVCCRAYAGLAVPQLIGILAVGYAFAWFSHVFVEGNRPATFLHPTFSFIADFQLLWLLVTSQLALDATAA